MKNSLTKKLGGKACILRSITHKFIYEKHTSDLLQYSVPA